MKVKEILEKMGGFTDEEREKYLKPLWGKFSGPSQATLRSFQDEWHTVGRNADGTMKPFEEFVKAQNEKIKMCIKCEVTEVGKDVRKIQGLEELTLETEIGG